MLTIKSLFFLLSKSDYPFFFVYLVTLFCSLLLAQPAVASPVIINNNGITLSLNEPANTIITLSPHASELVYSAGAGEKIIATVEHSDFPEQAKRIPRIGNAYSINIEKIINLNPDIIIAWSGGNNLKEIAKLQELGFKIYFSDIKNFQNISEDIKNIGLIAGSEKISRINAEQFNRNINILRTRFRNKKKVRVFYQLWHDPLMTINKTHFIHHSIALCGGINVFANSPVQVSQVNIESVIHARPDILIAAIKESPEEPLIAFNWTDNIPLSLSFSSEFFTLDPDLLHRPTVRLARGTALLCEFLDKHRRKL